MSPTSSDPNSPTPPPIPLLLSQTPPKAGQMSDLWRQRSVEWLVCSKSAAKCFADPHPPLPVQAVPPLVLPAVSHWLGTSTKLKG